VRGLMVSALTWNLAGRSGRPIAMTQSHLRYLLVAASAAAAGLLVACASPQAQTSSSGTSASRGPTPSPAPIAAAGLVPAPRGLTDRLILRQTRVTAGTAITGALVVTYRGRTPINLNRECRPQYAVALTNHRLPPLVGFRADCSTAPFVIKPGENRLAVTVATTYLGCTQDARQATSTLPACLHGRRLMPSLPPGSYQAVLVGDGLPLPAPAPVTVSLTAAG
jgi:hypothetical protein